MAEYDTALIKKYGERAFMYTEYPNWRWWSEEIGDPDYRTVLLDFLSKNPHTPLMLYVHIPHCHKQCLFCTCYVKITKDYSEVKRDVEYVFKELDLLAEFFDEHSLTPFIKEIHLGGGSPTYLREEEFSALVDRLNALTLIDKLDEFAIEIDPRHVKEDGMRYYAEKGISRVSFGVQDIALPVQIAVDRVQPAALTERLITPNLRSLFKNGVNFDIICGLPRQSIASMRKTMEWVARMSPDRVCLNYLHQSPEFYPHQLLMPQEAIPDNALRKKLFQEALEVLAAAGYVRVAYDHFAKPDDALTKAFQEGRLRWNRLGPTPGRVFDVIAAGYSGVSLFENKAYFQDHYDFRKYQEAVDKKHFPIFRGHIMSKDDTIRRDAIHTLRNYFSLSTDAFEQKHKIKFPAYFKKELIKLKEGEKDGIVHVKKDGIEITDVGRQFADVIASAFDAYK